MPKIMTKKDTERFLMLIASDALAGRPVNEAALQEIEGTHVDPDYLEAAAMKVVRMMAEHLNKIPERLDADFETTERARYEIDRMLADQVLLMKETFLSLVRKRDGI